MDALILGAAGFFLLWLKMKRTEETPDALTFGARFVQAVGKECSFPVSSR